jgi:hypothetical protein
MRSRLAPTLSRRRFLTAAGTGLFAMAAVSISCTSRGCGAGRAKAVTPLSTFNYVDRSGWIVTVDDSRKLGPLTPPESR